MTSGEKTNLRKRCPTLLNVIAWLPIGLRLLWEFVIAFLFQPVSQKALSSIPSIPFPFYLSIVTASSSENLRIFLSSYPVIVSRSHSSFSHGI